MSEPTPRLRNAAAPWDVGLTPARADRARRAGERKLEPAEPALDIDDLERGRTAAMIATLGRLQLQVDLLTRRLDEQHQEHQQSINRIESRLIRITELLAGTGKGQGSSGGRT